MTVKEKSETIIKWCSFLEDETDIPREELEVLWECHDLLCGTPVFSYGRRNHEFTQVVYARILKSHDKRRSNRIFVVY